MSAVYAYTAYPDSVEDGVCKKNNLQEILDKTASLPDMSFAHIKLAEGVYSGSFFFDGKRTYPEAHGVSILLEGAGEGKTVLTGSLSAAEILADGIKRGTFRTYTACFFGTQVELRSLTIENTAGPDAMQGIALYAAADKMICRNVSLLGFQDTLFLAPLPAAERENGGFRGPGENAPRKPTLQLYEGCTVTGTVDFIFGGAAALFRNCKIVVRCAEKEAGRGKDEGVQTAIGRDSQDADSRFKYFVAAPSSDKSFAAGDCASGLFFKGCDFAVDSGAHTGADTGAQTSVDNRLHLVAQNPAAHDVYIARPWRPYGRCFLFGCRIGAGFSPELWHVWNTDEDRNTAGFYAADCSSPAAQKLDQHENSYKTSQKQELCENTQKSLQKLEPHTQRLSLPEWGQPLSYAEKNELLAKLEALLPASIVIK